MCVSFLPTAMYDCRRVGGVDVIALTPGDDSVGGGVLYRDLRLSRDARAMSSQCCQLSHVTCGNHYAHMSLITIVLHGDAIFSLSFFC